MSLKQAAVSGSKWTIISTTTTAVIDIIKLAILARLLMPDDFGLMAMLMVVAGFASAYLDMGINAAIVQRQDISREQLSSIYWLNVISGTTLFLILWLVSPLVAAIFHEPRINKLLPIVAVNFIIMSLGLQFEILLEKELRFNLLAKLDISRSLVEAVVAITCAVCGQGVWSLVWGYLAQWGLSSLVLCWVGWSRWTPMFRIRYKDFHSFRSFGLYQMGERSILEFNCRVDQLLVGMILGTKELGFYNFAVNQLLDPICRVNRLLLRVAYPVLARLQSDIPLLCKSYLKMLKLLSSLNAPLFFGLAALAPHFIPMFFGVQWTPAIHLVQIIAIYGYFRSVCGPIGTLLLAMGRADTSFRWNLALLFTTSLFIYIGATLGGTQGVGIALLLLMLCNISASYFFLLRPVFNACGKNYAFSFINPALMATVMGGCVCIMSQVNAGSFVWLLLEVFIGVIVFVLLYRIVDRTFFLEMKEMLLNGKRTQPT